MKLKFILFIIAVFFIRCDSKKDKDNPDNPDLNNDGSSKIASYNFEKIPSELSGLKFSNTIVHNLETKSNVFDHDYFYNGSGVGIEDINNDGLKDIFFTGNQVPNKLFLNKGNLVFEDITASANINTNKKWSSGVTFADVNNDGWMDIYVSQGGPYNKDERKNLLLINQKDNTFIEQASIYGLDDHGISTHSAFFDFDKDGDLDGSVAPVELFYKLIRQFNF